MAPVFQDNHNPEPVITSTSSDTIGQLYSTPPIFWDRRATDPETVQDIGNAANLPVPISNTPILATPNHVLENEHFLHISPRDISFLAARSSSESTNNAFDIVIIIILVVWLLVLPLLACLIACLGAACGLEAENQTNNRSNTRVTDPTPLNASSNTGVMPITPLPYQADSPPLYSNGNQC